MLLILYTHRDPTFAGQLPGTRAEITQSKRSSVQGAGLRAKNPTPVARSYDLRVQPKLLELGGIGR